MSEAGRRLDGHTALVTGGARRIGAEIARALHAAGMNVVIHYRSSESDAGLLCGELNGKRADSAIAVGSDLLDAARLPALVETACRQWGRLDVLVNNASRFYPTPVGSIDLEDWEDLMGSNVRAPLLLAQAAAAPLRESAGCIVNLIDVHAERPLRDYPLYSVSKAGLVMLTQALAKELGPEIRVNGISPGAILWPEEISEAAKHTILERTVLGRQGNPKDVAAAVLFLVRDAPYVTGQIISVDGGRTLFS